MDKIKELEIEVRKLKAEKATKTQKIIYRFKNG